MKLSSNSPLEWASIMRQAGSTLVEDAVILDGSPIFEKIALWRSHRAPEVAHS